MRQTPARKAILHLLDASRASEESAIFEIIKTNITVNTSTIYRALKDLESGDKAHMILCDGKRYWYACQCLSHEHICVEFCLTCHHVIENNSGCTHTHPTLISDKREKILSSCQKCPINPPSHAI